MTKYKFLCKKIINGKKRNIYLSDKTKKQYLKYKNKFMQVSKYKKLKNAKMAKKTKLNRKAKSYGSGTRKRTRKVKRRGRK